MTPELASLLQDAIGPDYQIEHPLEAGGMSRLFMALDVRHNRRVVVKVLPPELMTMSTSERFRREIDLTIRLQHPHILPIITSGSWEHGLYFISPFISGESLGGRIAREGKLPFDDISRIIVDVADALAFAHAKRIAHRDVKPNNILLSDGRAILADFGIARAMALSGSLTDSGVVPGTPAYMAPELPNDERADIYALGIVAYEMLCGKLPPRGVTAKQIVASRGKFPGDDRDRVGRLAETIARAVALDPSARVQTVRDFVASMSMSSRGSRAASWIGVAAIVAAITVVVAMRFSSAGKLDESAYAILPFAVERGLGDSTLSTTVSERVAEALAEWRDVHVSRIGYDAPRNHTGPVVPLREAKALARSVGARMLVWGTAERRDDSVAIVVSLYDLDEDRVARARRAVVRAVTDTSTIWAYRQLANSLLRDGGSLPWSSAADKHQPLLAAWRAADAGQRALDGWDLRNAETQFNHADSLDRGSVAGALGLAKTLMLTVSTTASLDRFRLAARHAVDLRSRLSEHDKVLASGLLALADRRADDACADFGRLASADSSDLFAWIGLAECQRADPVVVRDPHSPSGWRFRSSHENALRAFHRVADVTPNTFDPGFRAWYVARLSRLLPTETVRLRRGVAATSDTMQFTARAFLDHDTLAYIPREFGSISSGARDPEPELQVAAIQRNLSILREAVEQWLVGAPTDAAAYALLSDFIERSGTDAIVKGTRIRAIDALHRALRYSTDSAQRAELGVSEVRLLLEDGHFAEARRASDSLLASAETRARLPAGRLAGVAALTGRTTQVASFLRDSALFEIVAPAIGTVDLRRPLSDVAYSLVAFSSIGAPADSVEALARRFTELLPSYVTPAQKAEAVRDAVVGRALSLSYPAARSILPTLPPSTEIEVQIAQALAAENEPQARQLLDGWNRRSTGHLPGTVSVDGTYRRALFAVAVGDTTAAIRTLDAFLRALPTIGSKFLDRPEQAACLVRAAALRATLARRTGDARTAEFWANVVVTLWGNADRSLRPTVDSMRPLIH